MAKYEVSIDGQQYEVEIIRDDGRRALLKVDGREYEVEARNVSSGSAPAPSPLPQASSPAAMTPAPRPPHSAKAAPRAAQAAAGPADMQIRAPMPGLVLQVLASVGQRVKRGEAVFRFEAMKMENEVQSHTEGTVKAILVAQGDQVQEGEVLMVLEE